MDYSDERRMVAARLRKAVKEHLYSSSDLGESIAAEVNCYGYPREKVFTHLADLIDPTCTVAKSLDESDRDRGFAMFTYKCPECGSLWSNFDTGGSGWAVWKDGWPTEVRYCPHCGARILEQEDE